MSNSVFLSPSFHAPNNCNSSFTLPGFRTRLPWEFNPVNSQNAFWSGMDHISFFPELHACIAFIGSRDLRCLLFLITALLSSSFSGFFHCPVNLVPVAKANHRVMATLLTCSWSSSKTGLRVVKVLIRHQASILAVLHPLFSP